MDEHRVVEPGDDGSLVDTLEARLDGEARRTCLPAAEARVLQLLARRLERERRAQPAAA